jgi:hypothetical protein
MWNLTVFDHYQYKISSQVRMHYQYQHRNHQEKYYEYGDNKPVDKHNRKHYLSLLLYHKVNRNFQYLLVAMLLCEDLGEILELYRTVSWKTLTEYEEENRTTLRQKTNKHKQCRDYLSRMQTWD